MTVKEALRKYWYVPVAVFFALLALMYFVTANGVTNDGNKKQQDLITFYNDTTNVLSDCLVKTKQSIGATDAQANALKDVITSAVQGRYTKGSTAQPGSGQNALFNAIVEKYPDTAGLSKTFQDVLIVINGCRGDFRDAQAILQRGVTRFNQWRTGSFTVRNFGGGDYPNSDLAIKVNNKLVTGQAALDQMRTLVVVSDAQTGRDTGKIENKNPFK